MKLNSVEAILDFAIEKEEDAAQFYQELAAKMDREYMRDIFLGFSKEEKGHKKKLLKIKAGEMAIPSQRKVDDLKIGDHLTEVDLDANIDFQDALILAMKAEKAAFKLYTELAKASDDEGVKNLFLSLAQEEAKHKLRFEVEYDEYVYREN